MKCIVLLDIIFERSFTNEPFVGFIAEEDDSGRVADGEIEGCSGWTNTL